MGNARLSGPGADLSHAAYSLTVSVDHECNVLMSMRSVAAIASVMHHATQASASSAYGYRQVGDPAGHQETARATVMCPGYRCRCACFASVHGSCRVARSRASCLVGSPA